MRSHPEEEANWARMGAACRHCEPSNNLGTPWKSSHVRENGGRTGAHANAGCSSLWLGEERQGEREGVALQHRAVSDCSQALHLPSR